MVGSFYFNCQKQYPCCCGHSIHFVWEKGSSFELAACGSKRCKTKTGGKQMPSQVGTEVKEHTSSLRRTSNTQNDRQTWSPPGQWKLVSGYQRQLQCFWVSLRFFLVLAHWFEEMYNEKLPFRAPSPQGLKHFHVRKNPRTQWDFWLTFAFKTCLLTLGKSLYHRAFIRGSRKQDGPCSHIGHT